MPTSRSDQIELPIGSAEKVERSCTRGSLSAPSAGPAMCSVPGCTSKSHIWDGQRKLNFCIKHWLKANEEESK